MEIVYEINYDLEASILLERKLFRKDQNNRMVNYLSRFKVEKEEVKKLYAKYDQMVEYITIEMDKLNLLNNLDNDLISLFNPLFDNECIINHFVHTRQFINDINENSFFEYILNRTYKDKLKKVITINSSSDLLNVFDSLSFDDKKKLILLNFYSGYNSIVTRIDDLFLKIIPIIKKGFKMIESQFKIIYDYLKIESNVGSFLKEYGCSKENLVVYVFVLRYSVWEYDSLDKNYFGVNYMFNDIVSINDEKNRDKELAIGAFKAIGDKKRYELIRILSVRRKMYVQEMAQALEITPATVLHHIEVLKSVGLVNTCVDSCDNKKIFYELNKRIVKLLKVNLDDLMGGIIK